MAASLALTVSNASLMAACKTWRLHVLGTQAAMRTDIRVVKLDPRFDLIWVATTSKVNTRQSLTEN